MTTRIGYATACFLLFACLLPVRLLADTGGLRPAAYPNTGQRPSVVQPAVGPAHRRTAPAANSTAAQPPGRRITRPGDPDDASARKGTRQLTPVDSLWTTFGALLVLIAIILVAARIWKQHLPKVGGMLSGDVIQMLGRRPIDQKRQLQMIRIGSRILVVGTWAEGMVTLAEITDPSEVDCLAGLCRESGGDASGTSPFANLFRRQSPSSGSAPQVPPPPAESPPPPRFQVPTRPEIDVQAS